MRRSFTNPKLTMSRFKSGSRTILSASRTAVWSTIVKGYRDRRGENNQGATSSRKQAKSSGSALEEPLGVLLQQAPQRVDTKRRTVGQQEQVDRPQHERGMARPLAIGRAHV